MGNAAIRDFNAANADRAAIFYLKAEGNMAIWGS
jgi:hypothetical protein